MSANTQGGARPGSGRKTMAAKDRAVRRCITLTPSIDGYVTRTAKRWGLSRSAAISYMIECDRTYQE